MPAIIFYVVGGIFWLVAGLATCASLRSTRVKRMDTDLDELEINEEVNGACLRNRK